jgi:hypothetical protein
MWWCEGLHFLPSFLPSPPKKWSLHGGPDVSNCVKWLVMYGGLWLTMDWTLLKQCFTNRLALPIDKMLYIYSLGPHSEHQNNSFQSKRSKHFHQRNTLNTKTIHSNLNDLNTFTKRNRFIQCDTGFNMVKLAKVGSNAIVLVPVWSGPNYFRWLDKKQFTMPQAL